MKEKPIIQSKSNIVKILIFFLIVFCVAFLLASYLINDAFRDLVDRRILKKQLMENDSKIGRAHV